MDSSTNTESEYKPANGLAKVTVAVFWILIGECCLEGVLDLAVLFGALGRGNSLDTHLLISGLLLLVWMPMVLLSFVLFPLWVHRVSSNLRVFGDVHPGWVDGWAFMYFLPVAPEKRLIYKPWKAAEFIWKKSHPKPEDQDGKAPSYLERWWSLTFGAFMISLIVLRFAVVATEGSPVKACVAGSAVVNVLFVVAARLCIRFVKDVTAMQNTRAQTLPHIMTTTPGT